MKLSNLTSEPGKLRRRGRGAGFTLIEIILALSIALGLLVVALFFYSQTANLRGQLLDESDRLAALRLVMDRLTAELRSSLEIPQHPMAGDFSSLSFVTVAAPIRQLVQAETNAPSTTPLTDLRLVHYGLGRSVEGTNEIVTGLYGTIQPLLDPPRGRAVTTSSNLTESTNTLTRGQEPLSDAIRLFRLRYWDGAAWLTQWTAHQLPGGIEVTLGLDPLPDEALLTEYTGELFRRVIRLPGGRGRDTEAEAESPDLNSNQSVGLPPVPPL